MATLSPQSPTLAGATLSMAAVAASDKFANPYGTAFIQVANGNASSITVTLTARVTNRPAVPPFGAQTVSDNVVTIATGVTKLIGPIPKAFNDTDGNVTVTCSLTPTVTIAVLQPAA